MPRPCSARWHNTSVILHMHMAAGFYVLGHAAAREKVVGWYSTGPRLREADIDITDLLSNYCDTPLLVICEVQVRLMQVSDRGHVSIMRCAASVSPSCRHNSDSLPCLQPKAMGLPTTAYYATDEIREVQRPAHMYVASLQPLAISDAFAAHQPDRALTAFRRGRVMYTALRVSRLQCLIEAVVLRMARRRARRSS